MIFATLSLVGLLLAAISGSARHVGLVIVDEIRLLEAIVARQSHLHLHSLEYERRWFGGTLHVDLVLRSDSERMLPLVAWFPGLQQVPDGLRLTGSLEIRHGPWLGQSAGFGAARAHGWVPLRPSVAAAHTENIDSGTEIVAMEFVIDMDWARDLRLTLQRVDPPKAKRIRLPIAQPEQQQAIRIDGLSIIAEGTSRPMRAVQATASWNQIRLESPTWQRDFGPGSLRVPPIPLEPSGNRGLPPLAVRTEQPAYLENGARTRAATEVLRNQWPNLNEPDRSFRQITLDTHASVYTLLIDTHHESPQLSLYAEGIFRHGELVAHWPDYIQTILSGVLIPAPQVTELVGNPEPPVLEWPPPAPQHPVFGVIHTADILAENLNEWVLLAGGNFRLTETDGLSCSAYVHPWAPDFIIDTSTIPQQGSLELQASPGTVLILRNDAGDWFCQSGDTEHPPHLSLPLSAQSILTLWIGTLESGPQPARLTAALKPH